MWDGNDEYFPRWSKLKLLSAIFWFFFYLRKIQARSQIHLQKCFSNIICYYLVICLPFYCYLYWVCSGNLAKTLPVSLLFALEWLILVVKFPWCWNVGNSVSLRGDSYCFHSSGSICSVKMIPDEHYKSNLSLWH